MGLPPMRQARCDERFGIFFLTVGTDSGSFKLASFKLPEDWMPDEDDDVRDHYFDFSEILNDELTKEERGALLDRATVALLSALQFMVKHFGLKDSVALIEGNLNYQKRIIQEYVGEKLAAQCEAFATGEDSDHKVAEALTSFFSKTILDNLTDSGSKRFSFPKGTVVEKLATVGVCIKEPKATYFCQVVPNYGCAEKALAIEETFAAFLRNFIDG
jgi:hypothetical protein